MGRRRSRKVEGPKKKPKLDKVFDCPFCGHNNTVEVKMDRQGKIGKLSCRMCGASYEMRIHYLHEPVDVYCDWVDQCHNLNVNIEEAEEGEGEAETA